MILASQIMLRTHIWCLAFGAFPFRVTLRDLVRYRRLAFTAQRRILFVPLLVEKADEKRQLDDGISFVVEADHVVHPIPIGIVLTRR